MTLSHHLLDLLGIRLPIIQAPMAGISSPAMAAAVSEAGALGSIGVGATDAAGARGMIAKVRERSAGPLNVNLFVHQPAAADLAIEAAWIERLRPAFAALGVAPPPALSEIYKSFVEDEAMLAMLLEERPHVVSFHFGLPGQAAIRALRDAGIILLASATSLAEARQLADGGAKRSSRRAGKRAAIAAPSTSTPPTTGSALSRSPASSPENPACR